MGHLEFDRTTRAESTPPEWLSVGAQIGVLANELSGRSDLVAFVGPGAGGGQAPARFNPATAEVEVNVDVAFGKGATPSEVGDLRVRDTQFEWPRATGVIFHEALHARFSLWDLERASKDLDNDEFMALILLEEGRIESLGISLFPGNSGFLRACALEIVLADLAEDGANESDTRMAARLAALSLARVDAGVLDESDVAGLRAAIESKLSTEKLDKLRQIWLAAQAYDNHTSADGMYGLAREWARIVKETAEENGDPEPGEGGMGGASEFISEMLEELENAADSAAIGAYQELDAQQTSEKWKEQANTRAQKAKREKEHKDIASEVFGRGTGPMPDSATRSSLRERREPTSAERAAAVKVASLLERAKYRERDETEIHSIVPPGRLRTRALVQGAALKSKGVMQQAEPWRRTVRKHIEDPTLTIGVLVDISGSMGEAMQPMATTAWVMSMAARRVQGKCAMVYYGQDVFPTLKPGQHLDKVEVYTAPDGTEKFNKAFKALDGALNLLGGTGARLLVVVSDGCYIAEERAAARKWMAECQRANVGVLWLTFDDGRDTRDCTRGSNAVVMTDLKSPEDIATEIGAAAAKALTAVS